MTEPTGADLEAAQAVLNAVYERWQQYDPANASTIIVDYGTAPVAAAIAQAREQAEAERDRLRERVRVLETERGLEDLDIEDSETLEELKARSGDA